MRLVYIALVAACLFPDRPSEAKAPDLPLKHQRFVLTNGLTLIVNEDHSSPLVTVLVSYRVGSRDESPGEFGLAHLFEHLMFNGSEHQDGEWFHPLMEIGATSIGGATDHDHTTYHQTVPTGAVDRVLWLESDRMGHLLGAVTQAKLDEQRRVVENEIRQNQNTPFGRLNDQLLEALFPPQHPYHRPIVGTISDLTSASLAKVHEWFRTYYGPNNAILVLSGDIDPQTALEKTKRYFGDIPPTPEVGRWAQWIPDRQHNSRDVQYDSVSFTRVKRAWATPGRGTREHALLSLAAAILGEGRSGLLPAELVHREQLATMAYAAVSETDVAGMFEMWVDLKPGVDSSIGTQTMDNVVAAFLQRGPTAAELERAIAAVTSNIARNLGNGMGRAVALAAGEACDHNPAFLNRYLEWIDAATVKDVREAARRYLSEGWHQTEVLPRQTYSVEVGTPKRPQELPPVSVAVPTAIFPETQAAELANGLRLVVAERHNTPFVFTSVQFDAGNAVDFADKPGLAAFAIDLLDEGTQSRSALEISAEATRLGVDIATYSDLDYGGINVMALSSQLAPAIALLSDIVQNATFGPVEIESVRSTRSAAVIDEQSDPERTAFRILRQLTFGRGHGYGIPRSGLTDEAAIRAITREDLLAFKALRLRPDNATILVAGNTTLAEIRPLLERAFRTWHAPDRAIPAKNIADVTPLSAPRVILVDRPGSPQSLILGAGLAPPSNSPNNLAIEIVNSVLGANFTSRINMNLRETKNWSYAATSGMADARGQRSFQINAPVQADRTADALAELIRELHDINGKRPISEAEMVAATSYAIRQLPGAFEHAGSVLVSLHASAALGRPYDYPNSLAQRYSALTLDDVRKASRQLVQPQSMIWIIVGDRSRIENQIAVLNIARIEHWTADGRPSETE
jgi:zinc protease